MFANLLLVLPIITLLIFFIRIIVYKKKDAQSCLIFILYFLPLMNLKIVKEAWGGFRTFDFICIYCLIFLFKDFVAVQHQSKNKFYFFLFLLFCIVIILGGLTSEFPGNTYLNLLKSIPVFIFSRFFILECYNDPDFHTKAIKALKTSYIIDLSFLFIQMVVGLKFSIYPDLNNNTIDTDNNMIRYPGIFYDSQASGQYLAMGSFLFLMTSDFATLKTKLVNYAVFALAVAGIVFAGSRSAIGGLVMGLVFVVFTAGKKFALIGGVAMVVIFIGLSVSPARQGTQGILGRTQNISEDYLFRQSLWKEAFGIAEKHPYLGIGSGNYQQYVMKHAQDQYLEIEPGNFLYFDQPENGYLKIAVELGFIGIGIFALLIIAPLIKATFNYFSGRTDRRVLFLIGSIISWLIAFNTVYSIYDARILIMVASMLALIIAYPLKKVYIYEFE